MNPDTWLDIHALNAPERTALTADGEVLDYAGLRREASSLAVGLAREGVRAGTRVGVGLTPGLDYGVLVHALLLLRATLCPLNPTDPVDDTPCDLRIMDVSDLPSRAKGPAPGGDGSIAPICEMATSGSTGVSRRVPLSVANVLWSALGTARVLPPTQHDDWLVCLPLFHVSGLMPLYRALVYGTSVSIQPGFDSGRVAAEMDSGRITGVSLVPTALGDLLATSAESLALPDVVLVGGSALPEQLLEEALRKRVRIAVTYGMTETTSQVTVLGPDEVATAIGSVGRPLVSARVSIDEGEVLVGGPVVSSALLGPDGWMRTGDRGRLDGDGRLWIEGRVDEVIITGGENVVPARVESVLREHPSVEDALVFGIDHPRWQQAVHAAVVPREGCELGEAILLEHCRTGLAPYEVPKRIELVETLPLGPTGKPDRLAMAKRSAPKQR